jgi:hypothetical protein
MSIYEVRPQDHPSCHACGKGMIPTGYKCLSCGTTTEATMPESKGGDLEAVTKERDEAQRQSQLGWGKVKSNEMEAIIELRKYLNQCEGETVVGGIRNMAQAMMGREEEIEQLNAELAALHMRAEVAEKERDELRTMFENAFSCAKNAIRGLRGFDSRSAEGDGTMNEREMPRIAYVAMDDHNRPAWEVIYNRRRIGDYYGTEQEAVNAAILLAFSEGQAELRAKVERYENYLQNTATLALSPPVPQKEDGQK